MILMDGHIDSISLNPIIDVSDQGSDEEHKILWIQSLSQGGNSH